MSEDRLVQVTVRIPLEDFEWLMERSSSYRDPELFIVDAIHHARFPEVVDASIVETGYVTEYGGGFFTVQTEIGTEGYPAIGTEIHWTAPEPHEHEWRVARVVPFTPGQFSDQAHRYSVTLSCSCGATRAGHTSVLPPKFVEET